MGRVTKKKTELRFLDSQSLYIQAIIDHSAELVRCIDGQSCACGQRDI